MWITADFWRRLHAKKDDEPEDEETDPDIGFHGIRTPEKDGSLRCPHCPGVRLVKAKERLWCPWCTRGFKEEDL